MENRYLLGCLRKHRLKALQQAAHSGVRASVMMILPWGVGGDGDVAASAAAAAAADDDDVDDVDDVDDECSACKRVLMNGCVTGCPLCVHCVPSHINVGAPGARSNLNEESVLGVWLWQ